jgi:hypothetical protein
MSVFADYQLAKKFLDQLKDRVDKIARRVIQRRTGYPLGVDVGKSAYLMQLEVFDLKSWGEVYVRYACTHRGTQYEQSVKFPHQYLENGFDWMDVEDRLGNPSSIPI